MDPGIREPPHIDESSEPPSQVREQTIAKPKLENHTRAD